MTRFPEVTIEFDAEETEEFIRTALEIESDGDEFQQMVRFKVKCPHTSCLAIIAELSKDLTPTIEPAMRSGSVHLNSVYNLSSLSDGTPCYRATERTEKWGSINDRKAEKKNRVEERKCRQRLRVKSGWRKNIVLRNRDLPANIECASCKRVSVVKLDLDEA